MNFGRFPGGSVSPIQLQDRLLAHPEERDTESLSKRFELQVGPEGAANAEAGVGWEVASCPATFRP
jgi:hypothetical protein